MAKTISISAVLKNVERFVSMVPIDPGAKNYKKWKEERTAMKKALGQVSRTWEKLVVAHAPVLALPCGKIPIKQIPFSVIPCGKIPSKGVTGGSVVICRLIPTKSVQAEF